MKNYGIKVMPKAEVLDSQGRAVEKLLKEKGFNLSSLAIGKYIEIKSEAADGAELKKMGEYVLYNPLIETITITEL